MDAEAIRLGAAAKRLLEDETVMEALENIRQRHIKTMTAKGADRVAVMKARGAILAIGELIDELNGMVADGELEKRKQ
jgi:hypothetical protein